MQLKISQITKDQLAKLMLVEAKKEGWLYSQHDIDFYFNFPRNHIYAASKNDQLIGCLIRHESASQFNKTSICSAGFFLVNENFRGQKIVGPYLWDEVLTKGINHDTLVCFHSVPRAVDYYNSLGYKRTGLENLIYVLKDNLSPDFLIAPQIKFIQSEQFGDIEKYNQLVFNDASGLGFCEFVQSWMKRPDAITVAYYQNNRIKGYGIATACHEKNYRISPLYADTPEIACEIIKAIVHFLKGDTIYLFTLSDSSTQFGTFLNNLGFFEKGKNFIVCNRPELLNIDSDTTKHIFCSIPLEYPHEIVSSLS